MNDKNQVIAVFDFDGTITRYDTFRDFFIWAFGPIKFYTALAATSPFVLLYLIGIVKNDLPKSLIFHFFFKGYAEERYLSLCQDYAKNRLPEIIRPSALERIDWHKTKRHILIINSASLSDWISPWASENDFDHVIATSAKVKNKILDGGFSGPCSYGTEKVKGLHSLNYTKDNSYIYAYGDSKGDRDLLQIADIAGFREFH